MFRMKRNLDRDVIEFHYETNHNDDVPAHGIVCSNCAADGYKMGDTLIGTSSCLWCDYCYDAKIRYHDDGEYRKFDGHVKCLKNNPLFINKIKHKLWQIDGCCPDIKNLNSK